MGLCLTAAIKGVTLCLHVREALGCMAISVFEIGGMTVAEGLLYSD